MPRARILLAVTMALGAMVSPVLAEPLPAELAPSRMAGVGLNTSDLERAKTFYTEVLGFKVAARVPASGEAKEYLLSLSGQTRTDTLVVLTKSDKAQAGAANFGRLVLTVPNGRKLAERAQAAGYPVRKIVDGTNMITDPDGYTIELYQRPAPPAASPAGGAK